MEQLIPNKIVKAGDVVFKEGDLPSEGIYFICYGQVAVSRMEFGHSRELARLAEGDVFGEMGIINSAARNATVQAVSDCGFFTLSQQNFQHRVNQLDPMIRGAFRVFVLAIRDLMAEREQMAAYLQSIQQYLPPAPVAAEPSASAAAPSGGLVDGVTRKLHY